MLRQRCFSIPFRPLSGCMLNHFGFPYSHSVFTFIVYSISYFTYSDKASIFSRLPSHHPSVKFTCVGLRENDFKNLFAVSYAVTVMS